MSCARVLALLKCLAEFVGVLVLMILGRRLSSYSALVFVGMCMSSVTGKVLSLW